jgi:hypothetical protein
MIDIIIDETPKVIRYQLVVLSFNLFLLPHFLTAPSIKFLLLRWRVPVRSM